MVEFANQIMEKQGKKVIEAIKDASIIRLRPILMTTFSTVFSAIPLALASGAGAESRRQIGLVIIGGMIIGTLFTLYVIPMVYTWLGGKDIFKKVGSKSDSGGNSQPGPRLPENN
jgi:multidrug efflux pump